MEELVSIVVPIYNNEKDLKRCLDSIINQTYENLEIILVDDGSTDNSLEICNQYKRQDKRIKVICKKNGGVSQARNIGIKETRGVKLVFIDSDDYVDKYYIEKLMQYKNSYLVICGYFTVNKKEIKEYAVKKNMYMEKEEILKSLTRKSEIKFYSVPYLKLFDKKIIDENNILFDENMEYGEDTCFVYEYISKINSLQFIDEKLYYNDISREDSLSRKKRENSWNEMYKVFKCGYKLYSENFNKYKKEIAQMYLKSAKTTLNNALACNKDKKNFINLCEIITKIEEFKNIKIRVMSIYDMLVLILLKTKNYLILRKMILIK